MKRELAFAPSVLNRTKPMETAQLVQRIDVLERQVKALIAIAEAQLTLNKSLLGIAVLQAAKPTETTH